MFPHLKNIDSYFMKLISKYRFEKACHYAVFSPTETHTFQPGLKKARKASQFSKR